MANSNIVEKTHQLMIENHKYDVAIDATCGNGYDSLFLANYYKKVIAIDIQPLAIKRTLEKTLLINNISPVAGSIWKIKSSLTV